MKTLFFILLTSFLLQKFSKLQPTFFLGQAIIQESFGVEKFHT